MPPVGFVADVGQLIFEPRGRTPGLSSAGLDVPGWPPGLLAGLRRPRPGQARRRRLVRPRLRRPGSLSQGAIADKGLAFVIDRLASPRRDRRRAAQSGGRQAGAGVAGRGAAGRRLGVARPGWTVAPARHALRGLDRGRARPAEALGPEDVFELEHGTALAAFGQRVALRQVLQAADDFEKGGRPSERPRPPARRHDVATRILDEDTYPVGGFSSISTRGSIESLLALAAGLHGAARAPRPVRHQVPPRRAALLRPRREPVPPPAPDVPVRARSRPGAAPGSRTPGCPISGSCSCSRCWSPPSAS